MTPDGAQLAELTGATGEDRGNPRRPRRSARSQENPGSGAGPTPAPAGSRILALDLGKRRIGLAISDPMGLTAQGLPNLVRSNKRADFTALQQLIHEREVGRILLGNPIHMSGREGRQSG